MGHGVDHFLPVYLARGEVAGRRRQVGGGDGFGVSRITMAEVAAVVINCATRIAVASRGIGGVTRTFSGITQGLAIFFLVSPLPPVSLPLTKP